MLIGYLLIDPLTNKKNLDTDQTAKIQDNAY